MAFHKIVKFKGFQFDVTTANKTTNATSNNTTSTIMSIISTNTASSIRLPLINNDNHEKRLEETIEEKNTTTSNSNNTNNTNVSGNHMELKAKYGHTIHYYTIPIVFSLILIAAGLIPLVIFLKKTLLKESIYNTVAYYRSKLMNQINGSEKASCEIYSSTPK